MVQWKEGVNTEGLQPVMQKAVDLLDITRKQALEQCSQNEAVITAGKEQGHSPTSLHHVGLALDLRTNDYLRTWASILHTALGVGWDVVVEEDHVHVERDPKKLPLEGGDTDGTTGY